MAKTKIVRLKHNELITLIKLCGDKHPGIANKLVISANTRPEAG